MGYKKIPDKISEEIHFNIEDYPHIIIEVDYYDHQIGINQASFPMYLSHQFNKGDLITCDPIDGVLLRVIEEPIGAHHLVRIESGNLEEFCPLDYLKKDVIYGRIEEKKP